MRHRSLFGFLIAVPMLAASATFAAFDRVMASTVVMLRQLIDLFAPEPFRLATDGPVLPRAIGGTPVDGALLHSRRHEAGVSRRAAARNT
jgi:hypothetical protein